MSTCLHIATKKRQMPSELLHIDNYAASCYYFK